MATPCGTIEVVGGFDASLVTIQNCSSSTVGSVSTGQPVPFTVGVENTNDSDAEATVQVATGGKTDEQTVTVPAGSNTTAEFQLTFNDSGSYNPEAEVVSASEA